MVLTKLQIIQGPFTKRFIYIPTITWYIIVESTIEGGFMVKLPFERGEGWVEWILIAILAVLILVTIFLLLRPALSNLWQDFIQSLQ